MVTIHEEPSEALARLGVTVSVISGKDKASGNPTTPLSADEALALGMIDTISTLEATRARVATMPPVLTPTRRAVLSRRAARVLGDGTLDGHRQQLARAGSRQ